MEGENEEEGKEEDGWRREGRRLVGRKGRTEEPFFLLCCPGTERTNLKSA